MLQINELVYRVGGRTLFDKATVNIEKGHRVGLVGPNGIGKTTLFKLILGELSPDSGSVYLRPGMQIGTVAQEAPSGSYSLIDFVLAADLERTELLRSAETANEPEMIAEIHTRLADIASEAAPARAARILTGLGFNESAQSQPCSEFSGGWRMRIALAATLFSNPDILLLDEPSNHLDLEAAVWLNNYLLSWQGTLIIISHDRKLLNKTVNEIIHLEGLRLIRYAGGYDQFEQKRREQQALNGKLRAKQTEQKRRIQLFVDRFRYKASKARQAQSRLKMLERMEPIASAAVEQTITFNFPAPTPLSPPLIALDDVAVGYDNIPVLRYVTLRIDMDDRIALLGANGNGKSTLVKLLAGRLMTIHGNLVKSSKLKVGYFAQHQADELILSETPYQHLARLMPTTKETQVRGHLGRFGFSGDRADLICQGLSGGEKARLLFCMMCLNSPHLLLLDEPTNHLDVDSREALVHALNSYDGAVILVSHDAHLIELVADRFWKVADGTCMPYEGNLNDYEQELNEVSRARRRASRKTKTPTGTNRKRARRERAAQRTETSALRKSVRDSEKLIENLTAELENLETRLADPEIYDGSTTKVMELQVRHSKIKCELTLAEETWLDLNQRLETME